MIDEADMVLEVIDARDPDGTRNEKLERIIEKSGKPLIIVVNKSDLVPREELESYKEKTKVPVVFISARNRKGTGILRREIAKLAKVMSNEEGREVIKVAVVGYPNVGKSTLINVLKGKRATKTASMPGYTKDKQLIRLSRKIRLIDSPGIVPVDDFNELVIKGVFPADKVEDPVKPALKLISRILETRRKAITEKFGIDEFESEEKILRWIGEKRGLIKTGGEVDIEETARWLLREWQAGRFTLFTCEEERKTAFIPDFKVILDEVEKSLLLDPRRILWHFEEELRDKLDGQRRVGVREIEGTTVGIATGFKKCDSAVKFLEELTGKSAIASECFGKRWKGVVAILD